VREEFVHQVAEGEVQDIVSHRSQVHRLLLLVLLVVAVLLVLLSLLCCVYLPTVSAPKLNAALNE
jgi:hypothetical protein